jgi:trehalose synthase
MGMMGPVSLLSEVPVPRRPVAMLEPVIGPERYARLLAAAAEIRAAAAGRTIWTINSTAVGGGVAEMLQVLVGYVEDLEIPIRWLVIGGDPEFFAVTKRLHNMIHGQPGDRPLSSTDAAHYATVEEQNAAPLLALVRPGDLVLLHDPQTAGLAPTLAGVGAQVVWRCHIGLDWENDATRQAWDFLRPHLAAARAYVFSRARYAPAFFPPERTAVIPPSIDPFSAKNQELGTEDVTAILTTIGVLDAPVPARPGRFVRRDGSTGEVRRTASVIGESLPKPDEPVVVQVSRWDRLKDMAAVMHGFATHVAPVVQGHLQLVGPAVSGVTDDPEGAAVYAECVAAWRELPPATRARIQLVTLPVEDVDENAAMVNALQRHASVITQKSLAEGFGLTVAEGMWKGRPVVGSAVGGIQDQIVDGTGVLLRDPTDLAEFGRAVAGLLTDPERARRIGAAAQAYVRECFVGDLHLLRYAELFGALLR